MTWIVGMPISFGYGFAVSDVRVTIGETAYADCLQKIYAVGPFIAAGFAGSVEIGFAMIDELRSLLQCPSNTAWDLQEVIKWWPGEARSIFAKFPTETRAGQCHLMLIGADPTGRSGNPWPANDVYILRSPDFEHEKVAPRTLQGIGSGNGSAECLAALAHWNSGHDAYFPLMRGEQGIHGGQGMFLTTSLTSTLETVQPNGVSTHLNLCWVYLGEVIIKANNHSKLGRWSSFEAGSGWGQIETDRQVLTPMPNIEYFSMPTLAQSWSELIGMLQERGLATTSATIIA